MLRRPRTYALRRVVVGAASLGVVLSLPILGTTATAGTNTPTPTPNGQRVSAVEQRLAALGYTLPAVAVPLAAYAPAVQAGRFVYTSGQLPFINGVLPATGKVGADVAVEDAARLAEISALNALAAVKSVVGDLDRVTRVVKVVGYVASAPGFASQPLVINGASNLLQAAFGPAGVHARSSVGVVELPLGSPVEIDLIVRIAK